jgi:predicted dehydrogenase
MVGGGPGAFIGDVHRKAACLDGGVELVAGCFSRDAEKSRSMAGELYLNPERCYAGYSEMIAGERDRSDGIDFVSIVTPNDSHFEVASAFLKAGFHVVLDKPMTMKLSEAIELRDLVEKSGRVFALTHNYTGYPMVKLARELVREKEAIGKVRKIVVQYPQGWLYRALEREGAKQAEWRTDPARSGAAGCMGDIGTHAENLAEYVTGLRIEELCADLTTFVEGRRLEDDGNCLVHYSGGARGVLFASQISVGELNGLRINVYGESGALFWKQEDPNELHHYEPDGTIHVYRRGTDAIPKLSAAAAAASRLPFGHPEAFYEAFANVYRGAADAIRARIDGSDPGELALDFPTAEDGVRGMAFVQAVVESGGRWVKFPEC